MSLCDFQLPFLKIVPLVKYPVQPPNSIYPQDGTSIQKGGIKMISEIDFSTYPLHISEGTALQSTGNARVPGLGCRGLEFRVQGWGTSQRHET